MLTREQKAKELETWLRGLQGRAIVRVEFAVFVFAGNAPVLQDIELIKDDGDVRQVIGASDGESIELSSDGLRTVDMAESGSVLHASELEGFNKKQATGRVLHASIIEETFDNVAVIVGLKLGFLAGQLLLLNCGDQLVALTGATHPMLTESNIREVPLY